MRTWRGIWLVGALALGACAPAREVWFAPNIGSPDLLDLFAHPEEWPNARGRIDVFKLYVAQVLPEEEFDCASCGPNRLSGLRAVDAFSRLHSWGIDLALEAGALKSFDCAGALGTARALSALQRVQASGATVRYVAMDEPLLAGGECGLDSGESLLRTARFVRALRGSYPDLAVGDIEPYPILPAGVLGQWVAALAREGVRPAFFHLDVDRVLADDLRLDVASDLRSLRDACRSAGVPFGVILWGGDGTSDETYSRDVLAWARRVAEALEDVPDHTIFQSWAVSPDGLQTVPRNLPEGDKAVFSHTRLVSEGLAVLRARAVARLLALR